MTSFGTMQRQQQDPLATHQSRSYGQYTDSNPSSTHSSPRTYPSDLEPYYPTHHHHNPVHSQTYPIPAGVSVNPYNPAHQRRAYPMQTSRSTSYSSYTAPVSLQVSTSTSSAQEHDPNERTARPSNAHVHAQFHSSLSAPMPSTSSTSNPAASGASALGGRMNADDAGGDGQQQQQDYVSSTPGLTAGLTRPLTSIEQERLAHLDRLKFFLATAPSRWDSAASNANPAGLASASGMPGDEFGGPFSSGMGGYPGPGAGAGAGAGGFSGLGMGLEPAYHHAPPHPALNRFLLPNQEFVTCVLWNGLYHITGTDIVRALVFRFEAFGRPVRNMKKFEEGVFSDLRNLKPGVDACLEEPKSPFLDLLFKYQCIRTQKKQKVFYWFSVPHDRLFLDALERDLKREKMGSDATTHIVGEPAHSFTYDTKKSLYEQFSKAQGVREGEGELEAAVRKIFPENGSGDMSESGEGGDSNMTDENDMSETDDAMTGDEDTRRKRPAGAAAAAALQGPNGQQFLPFFSIFEGSPTYKQRRKKGAKGSSGLRKSSEDYPDDYERGRSVAGDSRSGRFSSQSRERRPQVPMPTHTSMMDEFGPGTEQAAASEAMSAAEMFLKQARGELVPPDGIVRKPKVQQPIGEVGVYYSEGTPSEQQSHMRGRSFDAMGREGSVPRPSGAMSAGYATTTFAEAQGQTPASQQGLTGPGAMATGMAQYEAVGPDGKVRAFVCPLYSCGRLFKRMEHLKRHLRTHTMERPFTCPRCSKKFSRSDNLTQHLRTHERTGHGSVPGGAAGSGDWIDGGDEADASGEGSASGGSPRGGSAVDSDDDGALHGMTNFHTSGMGMELFGDANSLGMMSIGNLDMSSFGFGPDGAGFTMGSLDAQMCEVEIPGGVQDVQGDEEGLLMRTGGGVDAVAMYRPQPSASADGYYSSLPSSAATSGMLFSAASNTTDFEWSRPQPSPAFSTGSQPSPPSGSMPHMQQRNGGYRTMAHHSHSHSSSGSSGHGDDYSSSSLSAPSHKQTFEHSTLYPPNMLDNSNPAGNIGPMRRHRSMTPSLVRNEPIRRPMTANSGEFVPANNGSPASVHSNLSAASGTRGYHPYAYSASNSRSNSTHNSPAVHTIPLSSEYAQVRRSDSRSSSYSTGAGGLHDQMRQMMHMDSTNSNTSYGDGLFRTDSPAPFTQTESPAAFTVDLPLHSFGPGSAFLPSQQGQPHQLHASTLPNQYGASQIQQYDGFYPQQHSTL